MLKWRRVELACCVGLHFCEGGLRGVWCYEDDGVSTSGMCVRLENWWLHNLYEEDRENIAMVAWGVWNERNNVVHGREACHPS